MRTLMVTAADDSVELFSKWQTQFGVEVMEGVEVVTNGFVNINNV